MSSMDDLISNYFFFSVFLAAAGFFFAGFAAGLALGFVGSGGFLLAGCLWAALAGDSFPFAVFTGVLAASGLAASAFAGAFGFASAAGFSAGGALTGAGAPPVGAAAARVAYFGLRPRFLGAAPCAGASFLAARPRRTGAGGGGGAGGL